MSEHYASPYHPEPVGAAQRLAEIVCARQSAESLAAGFWNQAVWKKKFADQVRKAHALLKVFEPAAIFAALQLHSQVRSLLPKWVETLILTEQVKLDALKKRAAQTTLPPIDDPTSGPRLTPRPTTSIASKLKGL
jgi:hypothetical protein